MCLRLVDQDLFERIGRRGRKPGEKARIEAQRDSCDAREDGDPKSAADPFARAEQRFIAAKTRPPIRRAPASDVAAPAA